MWQLSVRPNVVWFATPGLPPRFALTISDRLVEFLKAAEERIIAQLDRLAELRADREDPCLSLGKQFGGPWPCGGNHGILIGESLRSSKCPNSLRA